MRCFERLLHQPMSFFDETHSAELIQKCSQEAMNYITIETLDKPKVWSNLCVCAALLCLLWRIHPWLAVGQLLYFPIICPLMTFCGKKLESYINQILQGNALRSKVMQEGFHAVRTPEGHAAGASLCGQAQRNPARYPKNLDQGRRSGEFGGRPVLHLPALGFYGLTFVLSAVLVIHGQMTVGLLSAAIGYSSRIHGLFHSLLNTFINRKKGQERGRRHCAIPEPAR